MNLKQLEAFIKVSDSKSFSKAAQELYLTQPTVSAHIQTLEKELKVRLFVRNTKTVKLSEDGKTLYHDHEEHEHHHHDHDHECGCGHDHDHEEHEHHHHDHDHECGCGHDHHDHHHHHADEVFTSWGRETIKKYTKENLEKMLEALSASDEYGIILRAKGMLPAEDGTWIYFDMVPEETEIREGAPEYTGRLCVIGSKLNEDKLAELFGL